MAIWSAEIKELENLYASFKGQLPELEKELEQLIRFEDPNVILLYSRRCLEVIITNLCECELKRPRGSEPLKGIIDKLNKEKKIPAHIASSMYGLNEISTYGTHPKGFDPEQVKPVLNNLNIIIKWYLKYKEFDFNHTPSAVEIFDKKPNKVIDFDQRKSIIPTVSKLRKMIPWSLGLVGLLAIIVIISWVYQYSNSHNKLPVLKYIYNLPQGDTIEINNEGSAIAFSPDGTKLVYVSKRNNKNLLYLRNTNEFESKILSGTEGASSSFFSPDSRWIAFFSNGMLKKISLMGGAPQIICEANFSREGYWGKDNSIIFSNSNVLGLMRVNSSGGTPEQITNPISYIQGQEEQGHYYPQIFPGNDIVLFTAYHNSEDMRIVAYSPYTGERWNIIENGYSAKYIKTGYLVYLWKGDLLTVLFNLKKMKVIGEPVVVEKGVTHFSTSDEGSLAFIQGNIIETNSNLIIIDKNQALEYLNTTISQSPRFSPDGSQILYLSSAALWIFDLERGTHRLFTDKNYETYWGVWTPDGEGIVFNSNLTGPELNLFWKSSDGTGSVKRLTSSKFHQQPQSWSIDKETLIYTEGYNPETGIDIFMIQMNEDTVPKSLIQTRFNEMHPNLSKNGRWLSYASDESGQVEVYVCSFPELDNKTLISKGGAEEPLWSPDGKILYYRDITGQKLMAVTFEVDEDIYIGKPELLFQGKYRGSSGVWGRNYDIAPDGERFVMIENEKMSSTATQINIIINWPKEVEELLQTFNKNK